MPLFESMMYVLLTSLDIPLPCNYLALIVGKVNKPRTDLVSSQALLQAPMATIRDEVEAC